jgi:hypothetical protein
MDLNNWNSGPGKMKKNRKKEEISEQTLEKEEGCAFSWGKLVEMKKEGTQFFAGDGFKRLRILDIDGKTKNIHMVCELGKKTWPLHFDKLEELHRKIHNGEINLIPYEIDRWMPTWGNFIAGLFKYLGCDKRA